MFDLAILLNVFHSIRPYAANYSGSPPPACSPPKLGGARGGLNKLFCRLSFPLVFCLQRYNFFLNYANILPIILVIFSIVFVVLAEVLTALWQLMSYKTGQYLLELEEKPFAGLVVVRPHLEADRVLRTEGLKQFHILLTQQRC